MQYIFNDRRAYITSIEFRNTSPILNIEKIKSFTEEGLVGNFINKQFRYSFNNVDWSEWNTLSIGKLVSINFKDENNFFLHIVYTRVKIIDGNIESFYLNYDSRNITQLYPDSSIVDANTLQGQPGEYYLDRSNQIGPFTDLEVFNVADVSYSIGVYDERSDSLLGTDLYFKSIRGSGGIVVSESESGHEIILNASLNIVTEYDTSLDPELTMPASVGGISAGTPVSELSGDSFIKLFDDLLFPTKNPILTPPSQLLTYDVAYLQEVSTNLHVTFTSAFNRGSIVPQYNATNSYRSGPANLYYWTGPEFSYPYYSNNDNIESITHRVTFGVQSWGCNVSYFQGVQPFDNKGGTMHDGPFPAGSLGYRYIYVEGVYPYFATTENITTLTKQSLVTMSMNPVPSNLEWLLKSENGVNKQKFEIPNARLGIHTLSGIKFYNTNNGQWEYELGSAVLSLTRWTSSAVTEQIQGYWTNYTCYTYNGPDRGKMNIRLEF